MMNTDENIVLLESLRFHAENEVIEFKEAKASFDIDDLGKYFSALSNEANLRGLDFAWLIMGVRDKKREIVGTDFKNSEKALNQLKNDMAQHITGGLIFREILTAFPMVGEQKKRVLLFKIPASPRNIITCWKGIAYGRRGESLIPLDQSKQDEIRRQSPMPDWSEQIVPTATLDDIDELALAKARIMYAKVHSSRISKEEVDSWTVEKFLVHAGIMIDGKLTRAALLLLGKPTAAVKLRPAVAEVTWVLKKEDGLVADYEHFTIPFILTVDDILKKIRNITMRELPGGTLFPETMQQYDEYTIREALHNCLAHQDYTLQERVNFIESEGFLYYENGGTFVPETLENVLERDFGPQRYYRNRCLCEAMSHFNMIDRVGRGIQQMFRKQKERHFPMPDYNIDNEKRRVSVTIYGKIIDDAYARMLLTHTDLTLKDCILLDAVQKHRILTAEAIKYLRNKKLIEGRKPNIIISKQVAKATGQQVEYSRNKGLDENQCDAMITSALKDHGFLSKEKIVELLMDLLPKGLDAAQKRNRLDYILKKLRKYGKITYDKDAKVWMLRKD